MKLRVTVSPFLAMENFCFGHATRKTKAEKVVFAVFCTFMTHLQMLLLFGNEFREEEFIDVCFTNSFGPGYSLMSFAFRFRRLWMRATCLGWRESPRRRKGTEAKLLRLFPQWVFFHRLQPMTWSRFYQPLLLIFHFLILTSATPTSLVFWIVEKGTRNLTREFWKFFDGMFWRVQHSKKPFTSIGLGCRKRRVIPMDLIALYLFRMLLMNPTSNIWTNGQSVCFAKCSAHCIAPFVSHR